jgi:protein phosphatase
MTIVEIDQEKVLHLAHVGDSRCYVLNNRNLIQLTEDENVPGYQNVLTQALGSKEKLKIQAKDFQLTSGDVVFLCTDGVYNEIGDEYLKNKLMDGVTAESLISEVLLQNPKDNISAIIINVI